MFTLILLLFFTTLILNIIGLLPYQFTLTSHLIMVAGITLAVIMAITVIGILGKEFTFFTQLLPTGSPLLFSFILVPLEVISYIARPLSLAIRLGTNMICGHTLIKLILKLISFLISLYSVVFISITALFAIAILNLESVVAILQGYLLALLITLYAAPITSGAH